MMIAVIPYQQQALWRSMKVPTPQETENPGTKRVAGHLRVVSVGDGRADLRVRRVILKSGDVGANVGVLR
jgi:hypothetical protein